MTQAPKPPKVDPPIEIIEFVDHVPGWAVVAAVLAGMAIGAALLYFAINVTVEDATDA